MLLIDNELELRADLTFEEFAQTSLYAGRDMERNGAGFVLGDSGSRHTIEGLEGEYLLTLVFQDTIQQVSIDRDYTNLVSMNTTDKCNSLFFAELLRDELIAKELVNPELITIDYDRREDDSYAVFLTFKEDDPTFYETHDVWGD